MKKLPHEGLYTRLKPSPIHGVGVFAVSPIPKGTYVFPDDNEPIVWVNKRDVEHLPSAIKEFYDDFAIIKGSKYGSPRHFDALTTSWYLNDSKHPNVAADRHYRFYALRDIEPGEELTVDYRTYSDLPKNSKSMVKHQRQASVGTIRNGDYRTYRKRVSR
jgi:uncharacterized protein